jgi:hypothetical protein
MNRSFIYHSGIDLCGGSSRMAMHIGLQAKVRNSTKQIRDFVDDASGVPRLYSVWRHLSLPMLRNT